MQKSPAIALWRRRIGLRFFVTESPADRLTPRLKAGLWSMLPIRRKRNQLIQAKGINNKLLEKSAKDSQEHNVAFFGEKSRCSMAADLGSSR